jgi:hypothetical protein
VTNLARNRIDCLLTAGLIGVAVGFWFVLWMIFW